MHWIDLFALVPLITLAQLILCATGVFRKDAAIKTWGVFNILTGICASNFASVAYVACFIICIAGTIITFALGWYLEAKRR
jgi:hypothetical protein